MKFVRLFRNNSKPPFVCNDVKRWGELLAKRERELLAKQERGEAVCNFDVVDKVVNPNVKVTYLSNLCHDCPFKDVFNKSLICRCKY